MWRCKKCNREFEKENQNHYCEEKPKSIDEYILMQDENHRETLNIVRNAIKEVLPNAIEKIAWAMPTFWQGRNIIHFAGFKKHFGIYPGPEAIIYFSEELKEYKTSKGVIQFLYNKEVPVELIQKIALWCLENYKK